MSNIMDRVPKGWAIIVMVWESATTFLAGKLRQYDGRQELMEDGSAAKGWMTWQPTGISSHKLMLEKPLSFSTLEEAVEYAETYGYAFPADDKQWEEHKIVEVRDSGDNGWAIRNSSGWSLWIDKYSSVPKVGDTVRYYGKGLGFPVRGVFVAGVKVRYASEADWEAQQKAEQEERNQKTKQEAMDKMEETKARIAKLSPELQTRLERFQATNPDFWWRFMDYELMCCEQAQALALVLGSPEEWDKFVKLEYEEQKAKFPGMDEGHSGNSWGFVQRLAHHILVDPQMLLSEHGALAPLVGCETYGCHRDI